MAFEPGNNANPNGGRKERQFYGMLNITVNADNRRILREAAQKLGNAAAAGEPWAIKELADRLDGKPAQQVVLSGDEDSPIRIYAEIPMKSSTSAQWLVDVGATIEGECEDVTPLAPTTCGGLNRASPCATDDGKNG